MATTGKNKIMGIVYRKSYNITYCMIVVYVIVEYIKEKKVE